MVARRIPIASVPVVDQATQLMTREWYDFFAEAGQPARLGDYPNDAQAAAGGVPLYGLYRSGSTVKVRVT